MEPHLLAEPSRHQRVAYYNTKRVGSRLTKGKVSRSSVRRSGRFGKFLAIAIACLAMAACTSAPSGAAGGSKRVSGGTATIAYPPGEQFGYILPLEPFQDSIPANAEYAGYLMWRPLYWFGGPGRVGVDEPHSIAETPVFTTAGGKTTATIQLKSYRWSDGRPVTSRDVEFWFNLLKAEKLNWWDYVSGEFPDNVVSFKVLSPTRFSITFNQVYSPAWLYNELGQIIPLPQQAWDKESASGAVGNYDRTTRGAQAVYNFLAAQTNDLSTYATNPIWQVVDGPFKLKSYVSSSGDATYVRNESYSGPATGSISTLKVLSFTSDVAEFDALLSGKLNYGYVPFNDVPAAGRVTAAGYKIAAWPNWGLNWISLNFASPTVGAIFRQLYIRQAMQKLINQASFIESFLNGDGNPTYGPVPLVPSSQFLSSQQRSDPYPYSPSSAIALLQSHGWKIVRNGADTCMRPGTASDECGAGIAAGAKLSLGFDYATGLQAVVEEATQLETAFSEAGIALQLRGSPYSAVIALDVSCSNPNCWQMNYYGQGWIFAPVANVPDGGPFLATGAPANAGGYSNPTTDLLLSRLHSGGSSALYDYENYVAKNLPMLWMPEADLQVSALSSTLEGALPQDPLGNIYPEDWYFVR